ncbi:MAG TPA: ATP-binding cassette domain-containing protein [Hanamia sp.]|nr:ATP-binding cassette domain-containing protein [Hanamia sp.]
MITLEHVVKKFGNTVAVDDVSFEVNAGETHVLLGTSGCGKTTTLRMINRLTEVSSGKIIVAGKNIKEVAPEDLRRNIGYVLQNNGLFPHFTIAENIAIVPRLLKWPEQKISKRTSELLEQLHLQKNILSLYPQQLSGGQQQRVGLARALAADPPVLLMDEPFGALDAITRNNITKEFSNLEVLKTKTIVLVTHDIREAFELGDRILLMDKGKIVQQGKSIDLLFHPKSQFVSDFFLTQKMQLELHSVYLKDIFQHLEIEMNGENNLPEIDENKSLWEAIELLQAKNKKMFSVKDVESGEIKYAGYNSLFTGLEALKQQSHE